VKSIIASQLRAEVLKQSQNWNGSAGAFQAIDLRIDGDLDLALLDLDCPLEFVGCDFRGDFQLSSTRARAISFRGCSFQRSLSLDHATIDGYLRINNAQFVSAPAMLARRLTVKGDLTISGDSAFNGIVDLAYAVIEGSLVLNDVRFCAPGDAALVMSDAVVRASVDCTKGFVCRGQWEVAGMRIAGVCDLQGAQLLDPPAQDRDGPYIVLNGCALYADRLNVAGDLFLTSGFCATGEIRLMGAYIGGDLACWAASLCSGRSDGNALTLSSAVVKASVFLTEGTTVKGSVEIVSCDIEGKLKLLASTLDQSKAANAITLTQTRVGRSVEFGDCTVIGRVDFSRTMMGMLDLRFQTNVRTCSFALTQAQCGVLRDDVDAWSFKEYDLVGFTYDTLQEDEKWTIKRILEWLRNAQGGRFSPQPYEQLARVQRTMGFTDFAKEVSIERARREAQARRKTASIWRRAFDWLYGLLVQYGYRPSRALNWAVGLWLVGALLISTGHENGAFYRTKTSDSTHQEHRQKHSDFFSLAYSAEVLVPFLRLHQEEKWAPDHSQALGRFIQYYLWLHTIAGWVLGTFLVASVTSLVRKE
jgi:hypothetical protein